MLLRVVLSLVLSSVLALPANEPGLRARVASSVSVIIGVVVGPPSRIHTPHAGGEHTIDWYDAPVRILTNLRGEPQREVIRVAYSYAYDPVWHDSPKLRPGEEAIFLLHRFDQKEMNARVGNAFNIPSVEELLVIDPLDVQPVSARGQIAAMGVKP